MRVVIALGLCGMLVLAGLGAVRAQQDSPDCGPSALRDGRLIPEETATGLRFSGDAGEFLSESFALPEGNIIYASDLSGAENAIVTLDEAPRSTASGGGVLGTVIGGGEPIDTLGTKPIYDSGEFVLSVDSDVPWVVELEF